MRSWIKQGFSALLASVLVTTCGVFAAPATAAPGSLVAFGDSVMANPTMSDWARSKLGGGVLSARSGSSSPNISHGCAQDPNNFARRVAHLQGLTPRDYSCSGSTAVSGGKSMAQQVDEALHDGALNSDTREVLIQMGFNDTHTHITRNMSLDAISYNYVTAMVRQIDRIREHAPNARIKIVGYPSISDNRGACLLQLGNNLHSFEQIDVLIVLENLIERMQRDLAQKTGTQFVDVRSQSMGHGMCAPDGQRWYGAFIDLGQPRNMPVHMTNLGNQEVAQIVARA